MSTTDNGAIDYRRRLRESRSNKAAAKVAATASLPVADNPYDPPLEMGGVIEAAEVLTVVSPPATSPAADVLPSRTPQAVREQAKGAVVQLFSVSDEKYTEMMTELAVADPILYAAVVDEINDARAAETKTA